MDKSGPRNDIRTYGFFTEAIREVTGFMRRELILRGIIFLILGFLMICNPGRALVAITVTIGVFICLDGISMLFPALKYHGKGKFLLIFNAALVILLGLFTCTAPIKMNIIWVVMIGFWQFFNGFSCITLWKTVGNSALISGLCGMIAGLFLIFMPILGLMTLMWIMGIISSICGLSAILLGIHMKKI